MKKAIFTICLASVFVGNVFGNGYLKMVRPGNLQTFNTNTPYVFRCQVNPEIFDEEIYWILDVFNDGMFKEQFLIGTGRTITTALPYGQHVVSVLVRDVNDLVKMSSAVIRVKNKGEKTLPPVGSKPEIQFTFVPGYGSNQRLSGRVLGFEKEALRNYKVANYLFVPEFGWYNKPFWNKPSVKLNSQGNFSCNITTGPGDEAATIIYSCVIPSEVNPPIANGDSFLPFIPEVVTDSTYYRTLDWEQSLIPVEKRFMWGRVVFTQVPKIYTFENLKGRVIGPKKEELAVVVYIKVWYRGWWVKPYWNSSVTYLDRKGNFEVDITTGGVDHEATEIVAFIVPADYPINKANKGELLNYLGNPEVPQLHVFR